MAAGITLYTFYTVEAQRSQIRSVFGQYLAPAFVEQLAQSPEKLVLGGEEREMTMLFSDVRGFTAISEGYKDDPRGLSSLMNRLLTPLTNAIVGHEGTIDKWMAFLNAPLTVPNHEIQGVCSRTLPFRIGIGINTGRCVVGNLGSDLRYKPGMSRRCRPVVLNIRSQHASFVYLLTTLC